MFKYTIDIPFSEKVYVDPFFPYVFLLKIIIGILRVFIADKCVESVLESLLLDQPFAIAVSLSNIDLCVDWYSTL